MTQEIKSKGKEPKSNTPFLIIGGVLVVALIGAWYLYSTSKSGTANSNVAKNTNSNTAPKDKDKIPPNAPPGASPPNMVGSQAATVTLEEFADFQCGSCAAAHPVMNEIKSLYGSRIKFVYRNYPLSIPAHDKAYEASVAAEAAGLQGKFWDLQNLLFTNQQAWTAAPTYKQMWKGYAEKIGIDVAKWESDMAGIAAKGRVDADLARGKAIGVNSTPTLYINGISVPYAEMSVPKLKVIIDGELQKGTAPKEEPGAAPAANAANTGK
ncbi:MAG TPA: thioredoxin domain-containing protein [Pyrinomonadaceae bacterium]|mgnify:CR=1 FL=1|nr:thioredoxin domain-containing protein [Acidobacteriota bacterium]HQZ96199.1 thioredoxin domain-containing protein [Pyrinomonadaceae bacterium]